MTSFIALPTVRPLSCAYSPFDFKFPKYGELSQQRHLKYNVNGTPILRKTYSITLYRRKIFVLQRSMSNFPQCHSLSTMSTLMVMTYAIVEKEESWPRSSHLFKLSGGRCLFSRTLFGYSSMPTFV